jgi:hypothetical protein
MIPARIFESRISAGMSNHDFTFGAFPQRFQNSPFPSFGTQADKRKYKPSITGSGKSWREADRHTLTIDLHGCTREVNVDYVTDANNAEGIFPELTMEISSGT